MRGGEKDFWMPARCVNGGGDDIVFVDWGRVKASVLSQSVTPWQYEAGENLQFYVEIRSVEEEKNARMTEAVLNNLPTFLWGHLTLEEWACGYMITDSIATSARARSGKGGYLYCHAGMKLDERCGWHDATRSEVHVGTFILFALVRARTWQLPIWVLQDLVSLTSNNDMWYEALYSAM